MMKNDTRSERQEEFALAWLVRGRRGILNLCSRFGKTFTAINILEKLDIEQNRNIRVLIAYPDLKIRASWEGDFKKRNYEYSNVVFSTFASLKKHVSESFELIIIDECHMLSPAQTDVCRELLKSCREVLGLTGTLSSWTERILREDLGLPVIARYPIETAIREGILPDYEINIVRVPLDDKEKRYVIKGKGKTEKKLFDTYKYIIDKLEKEGKPSFFMKLKLISILQTSIAKLDKTIDLIHQFKDDRLLIFCGRTEIADNLGIPSYHSKSTEKNVWDDFVNGTSKHLAVCRIGNTGVTYTPLNKVIVNYTDSNSEMLTQKILRCMSLEYDNPEKKSIIYIISSTESIDEKWLQKALSMFDKNKIKYL